MDSEILSVDQWMLLLKFFKDPYMDLAETFTHVRKWSSVLYILVVKSSTYLFLLEFCKYRVFSRRVVLISFRFEFRVVTVFTWYHFPRLNDLKIKITNLDKILSMILQACYLTFLKRE